MSELTIHHCKVRLVRHGGWGWGPNPEALARNLVRALPGLLAPLLSQAPSRDAREIVAPVRLLIPLKFAELLALAEEHAAAPAGTASATTAVARRCAAALQHALQPQIGCAESAQIEPERQPGNSRGLARDNTSQPTAADVLHRFLLAWSSRGDLGLFLRLLSTDALTTWHQALWPGSNLAPAVDLATAPAAELAAAVRQWLAQLPGTDGGVRERCLRRIVVAVAVGAELRLALDAPTLWQAIDGLCPFAASTAVQPGSDPFSAGARASAQGAVDLASPENALVSNGAALRLADPGGTQGTIQPDEANEPPVSVAAGCRPTTTFADEQAALSAGSPGHQDAKPRHEKRLVALWTGVLQVESALPFLLLGPLRQAGYLDAVAAACASVDLLDALPAWASGLARKVLPPRRGSQRTTDAAVAFAGMPDVQVEPALRDLTRQGARLVGPLDAALALALLRGHTGGRPLLLLQPVPETSGWLLVDSEGLLPIAWAQFLPHLEPLLPHLEAELLLVPGDAVGPALLHWLNEQGLRFLTNVPPTRGEDWRAVRFGANGCWTNDVRTAATLLAQHGEALDGFAEPARRLWQALTVDRSLLPKEADRALDHSLALAAALGLGQLAWTLWGAQEPTEPLLALERLGSLDARVHISEDRVRVVLPLGKRALDLKAAGLLDDVPGVPWLGGRVVTFGKG